jgi:hypothetical protein
MMVCMAGLQVFIVRFFFQVCSDIFSVDVNELQVLTLDVQGARKGYV